MKMKLNTLEFVTAIKLLDRVSASNVLPILDSVKITVSNNQAILTRTNFDQTINVFIQAEIEYFGTVILPMKTIDMLKNLKDDYFELTETEIITEKKKISYNGLAVAEYPDINIQADQTFFEISEQELTKMLEVKYCMASDENRPILCGICFDSNRTIAIDGYRLSVRQGSYESDVQKVVVDAKTIELLDKVLDKKSKRIIKISGKNLDNKNDQFIKIEFLRDYLRFEIIGKTVLGEYMNYKQIIPQDFETTIVVNSGDMLPELEFMYKVANKEYSDRVMLITNENKLVLSGVITGSVYDKEASIEATRQAQRNADLEYYEKVNKVEKSTGNVKVKRLVKKPIQKTIKDIKIYRQEEVNRITSEVVADIQGKEWEAGFNMKYLYEAVKQYDGVKLKLKAISSIAPLVITPDGENIELVLPIRMR